MKIGLVTLFGYYNYGNKLQNYAVQTLLEKRGHAVETIIYYPNFYKHILINSCKIIAGFLHVTSYRRFYKFYRFSRKFIHVRYVRNKQELSRLSTEYDLFMVGSDQVWNPFLRKGQRDFYYLQFVEKEKRACIAPSFGIDDIPDEFRDILKNYIGTFPILSSREKEGVSIIKKLVNRDAWHLIDPTMALSKEEWMAIAKAVKLPKKPYIIKAFLGKTKPKRDNEISEIAAKNKWTVIDLFDIHGSYYNLSPDQFITLLNSAEFIFTDSFHCSAFAINFNRPFYVYHRIDKNGKDDGTFSRLDTLLSEFHILQTSKNLSTEINFSIVDEILQNKRLQMEKYLDLVLSK